MKFAKILPLLAAASLSGAHAATLCCDLAGSDGALDIIHEGAGNATLGGTLVITGSGTIAGGAVVLSSGTLMSTGTHSGNLSLGGSVFWNTSSIWATEISPTPGQVFNFDDPNWSVVSGGFIGGMTSPWESIFNLTAPTTVVSGAVPEPSSVAISALLVAAGLLRRQRVA